VSSVSLCHGGSLLLVVLAHFTVPGLSILPGLFSTKLALAEAILYVMAGERVEEGEGREWHGVANARA
jgi:hypothetical protein